MLVDIKTAGDEIRSHDNFLIFTHHKPDGDTLGAAFALLWALQAMGKKARVFCADGFPARYKFIYDKYTPDLSFEIEYVIAADVASVGLISTGPVPYCDRVDLNIDHHKSNTLFAKMTLLDAAAAAACEVMLKLISELGVNIDSRMATAIFAGISTDTGCFKFPNVTAETHRAAAMMIDAGADHAMVNKLMFDTKSRGLLMLERFMSETIEYYENGKIALVVLPADAAATYMVNDGELDGLSSFPVRVEGVRAGVTVRLRADDTYRVSIRSTPPIDASLICSRFGGGGHMTAAGCTMTGSFDEVISNILTAVTKELKRHEPFEGILCVDKPAGFTSFDVVAKLRGITGTKKIGHAGTLDPMATGVLPVLFGRATKAVNFLPNHDKAYEAELKLGITTDTQDITGNIIDRKPHRVTAKEFEDALKSFAGEISQIPPMYSAVKVDGRRLYDIARSGGKADVTPRKATVYSIELAGFDEEAGIYNIRVACSAGTYIRTICHDLGQALGCGAVMTALRRTAACGFTLEDCLSLDEIQSLADDYDLPFKLIPIPSLFSDYPEFTISDAQAKRFCSGLELDLSQFEQVPEAGTKLRIYNGSGRFLGLAEIGPSGNADAKNAAAENNTAKNIADSTTIPKLKIIKLFVSKVDL